MGKNFNFGNMFRGQYHGSSDGIAIIMDLLISAVMWLCPKNVSPMFLKNKGSAVFTRTDLRVGIFGAVDGPPSR